MIALLTAVVLSQAPGPDAPRLQLTPYLQQRGERTRFIDFSERKSSTAATLRTAGMVSIVAGGAAVVGGGVLWTLAKVSESRLRAGDPRITTTQQLDAAVRRGKLFEGLGWGLAGGGAAAIALGFGLRSMAGPAPETVSLQITPGGAFASVGGTWR